MTQGPRSADQARLIDPSVDQPARAVGLRLHSWKTRFGTSGMGFGTTSRGGVMHRHCLSTDPPASGSRAPQGLAESAGGGRRVVTSRAAASDDARSVVRETPALAVPPGRTTAVARTEGKGRRAPATASPRCAGEDGTPLAGRTGRGGGRSAVTGHFEDAATPPWMRGGASSRGTAAPAGSGPAGAADRPNWFYLQSGGFRPARPHWPRPFGRTVFRTIPCLSKARIPAWGGRPSRPLKNAC